MDEARVELDITAEVAEIALQYAYIAELGAQAIADEVRASIPESDEAAPAGMPPHSRGPYRDSWKATRARRRGNTVVAHAYSMASTDSGESLAEILDQGRGAIHPHPHLSAAERRAVRRVEAEIARVNAQLGGADGGAA